MAYTLLQSVAGTSASAGTTATCSLASVTAGNRVFAYTGYYNASGSGDVTLASVPVNTWTKLVNCALSDGGSGNMYVDLWTCVAVSTAAMTITMTGASGQEKGVTAQEYSGLDSSAGSGCVDVSAIGVGQVNNTTAPTSGTTAATHAANQLALSGVADWGANATWTVSAGGFVKDALASRDADATMGQAVAHKTSASGATEICSWADGGITNTDIAWVAVIKLASGGAAVVKPPSPRSTQAVHRAAIW